jgi:hypothetical protein
MEKLYCSTIRRSVVGDFLADIDTLHFNQLYALPPSQLSLLPRWVRLIRITLEPSPPKHQSSALSHGTPSSRSTRIGPYCSHD